jgi:GxxExxY protein
MDRTGAAGAAGALGGGIGLGLDLRPSVVIRPIFTTEAPRAQRRKPSKREAMEAESDPLTGVVIGAAIEVHRMMGPGLLETVYQRCLCHELELRGIEHQSMVKLPVQYKGLALGDQLVVDVIVENRLILELKSVERVLGVHEAQLLTYLKLSGIKLGLLMNFNVKYLKDGITRRIL